jgi:hypothetical protein
MTVLEQSLLVLPIKEVKMMARTDQHERGIECFVWNGISANVGKFLERTDARLAEKIALHFTREISRQPSRFLPAIAEPRLSSAMRWARL